MKHPKVPIHLGLERVNTPLALDLYAVRSVTDGELLGYIRRHELDVASGDLDIPVVSATAWSAIPVMTVTEALRSSAEAKYTSAHAAAGSL